MKVLVVTGVHDEFLSVSRSGTQESVKSQCDILKYLGHEIHVLYNQPSISFADGITYHHWETKSSLKETMPAREASKIRRSTLKNLIEELNPDIIFDNSSKNGVQAECSLISDKIKVLHFCHDGNINGITVFDRLKTFSNTARKGSKVVCISKVQFDNYRIDLSGPLKKIDVNFDDVFQEENILNATYAIDAPLVEKEEYFFMVSRLSPIKEIHKVLKSLAKVKPIHIKACWSILDQTDYLEKLKPLIEDLRNKGFTFEYEIDPTRERTLELFRKAKGFISGYSKLEANPITFIEALSFGIPIILLSEQKRSSVCNAVAGEYGFDLKFNDERLQDAIDKSLQADPVKVKEMVLEKHGIDKIAEQYRKLMVPFTKQTQTKVLQF